MAKTTSQIVAENKRKRAQERETDYQRNRQSVRTRKKEIVDQRRSPASRGDSTSGTQAEREQLENIISPKFFSQMLGERKNNLGPQKGYGGNETGNFAYPELHEFVSPAFFYQMTKDARDNRNLGKANETGNFPKLEELVSPEFFNQMLDQPTKNRDQKKRDLWEYNQGYHTQTDQVIYGLDMYEISRMTNQERRHSSAPCPCSNTTSTSRRI